MALVGIDVDEKVTYIPKCERGKENPTTFTIGILKNKDKMLMGGSAYTADDKGMKTAEMAWEMVKKCVKKIENFVDAKTKQMTTYTDITDDVLCQIGSDIIMELAAQISKFNNLDGGEEKK